MFDHVPQCCKAAVVIEAAFLMGPETFQRRGSVSSIRGAIRLKVINADFSRRMHVPAGFREHRRYMTRRAFRFGFKYCFADLTGLRWNSALANRLRTMRFPTNWGCRRWNCQLIEMQCSKL